MVIALDDHLAEVDANADLKALAFGDTDRRAFSGYPRLARDPHRYRLVPSAGNGADSTAPKAASSRRNADMPIRLNSGFRVSPQALKLPSAQSPGDDAAGLNP
jgi:hypothetical protein